MNNDSPYLIATQHWLEQIVIDLNLCPFAQREWLNQHVRFTIEESDNPQQLLKCLQDEMHLLDNTPNIHTTLLIHPNMLHDFFDYNDFVADAEQHLADLGYEGIYQLASFHPQYQFAGTAEDDVENYTNRSPYPSLHLLREDQLEHVLTHYPHPEKIPERNITLMNGLGQQAMQQKLQQCYFKTDT